ncbi:hypothetical protein DFH06DRAFT_1352330 [Mycena polygramma]|nr:hypothetical protein DFH06DRAFT_1352330 [Mycena polygramma]
MPAFEILHSGEYWQNIRRAKAARAARAKREPHALQEISGHWDGAAVVTFAPGNPVPYTSVLYANNVLVPVGPSSSNSATAPAPASRRARRVTHPIPTRPSRTNVIRRCQEREDAELLARLAAPRSGGKRTSKVHDEERSTKRRKIA